VGMRMVGKGAEWGKWWDHLQASDREASKLGIYAACTCALCSHLCVFPVSPQETLLPPRFRALSHMCIERPHEAVVHARCTHPC
jgi:hypothetical protein